MTNVLTRATKGSSLTHPETDENWLELDGKSGWFDYNDAATANAPIPITGGAGLIALTNDELGAFTNKGYPPKDVTDVWDASGGVFDWSELSLGDMVEIRLDVDIVIASVNTEIHIELHLGTGAGAYAVAFADAKNFKSAGTYKELRFVGIYMGDANTRDNGGQFLMSADKTCSVVVNGWYCKITKR